MDEIPEPTSDEAFDAFWDVEWRRLLFTQAMQELRSHVRAETFAAFEMYAIQDRPVKEVAEFLNMSVDSVYVAQKTGNFRITTYCGTEELDWMQLTYHGLQGYSYHGSVED